MFNFVIEVVPDVFCGWFCNRRRVCVSNHTDTRLRYSITDKGAKATRTLTLESKENAGMNIVGEACTLTLFDRDTKAEQMREAYGNALIVCGHTVTKRERKPIWKRCALDVVIPRRSMVIISRSYYTFRTVTVTFFEK